MTKWHDFLLKHITKFSFAKFVLFWWIVFLQSQIPWINWQKSQVEWFDWHIGVGVVLGNYWQDIIIIICENPTNIVTMWPAISYSGTTFGDIPHTQLQATFFIAAKYYVPNIL